MGRVVVTFRVMPTGPDVSLDPLEASLRRSLGGDLRDLTEQPVAFGLVGLEAVVILEDAEGVLEATERKVREVEGVGGVETLSVDLL